MDAYRAQTRYSMVPKPARVYSASQRDEEIIDDTFNKMHAQGKMIWCSQPTPYSYLCFMVWRDGKLGKKRSGGN